MWPEDTNRSVILQQVSLCFPAFWSESLVSVYVLSSPLNIYILTRCSGAPSCGRKDERMQTRAGSSHKLKDFLKTSQYVISMNRRKWFLRRSKRFR